MKKEEILKFYLNYRVFIFPVVTAISSIILIFLVIYPQALKLLSNQKAQAEISKRSNFLEAKAQALQNYDREDLNNKVNLSLTSYPADKDFANVIGLLQNLTAQLGFKIISLSIGGGSAKIVNAKSYGVKLDLVGPLKSSPLLINNIEQSPRLIKASGIETSAGGDPNLANITINLEVLYSPPINSYGSIDSPLPELSNKDQEILATLQSSISPVSQTQQATQGASIRGKANPFQ